MPTELQPLQPLIELLGLAETSPSFAEAAARLGLVPDRDEDRTDWESPTLGISLVATDSIIDTVFLCGGDDTYARYTGELPDGLSFDSTRLDIRAALGQPDKEGGPMQVCEGVENAGWDRYHAGSFFLHFTYAETTGTVELITLLLPSRAP